MKQKNKLTANAIKKALALRYPPGKWAYVNEMAFGTGMASGSDNRIDGWALNLWPSSGMDRLAFEIKVSRSDFRREMEFPQKHANALKFSHEFWFVAPAGIIPMMDIPEYAGLMEVRKIGKEFDFSVLVRAPHRDCKEPTWNLVCAMARAFEKNTKAPAYHSELASYKNLLERIKNHSIYFLKEQLRFPWEVFE